MNKPTNIADVHPTTPLQLGMLYHAMSSPDSAVFLQHYAMYVDGPFNPDAYADAWQKVANRHSALRSSFHWQGLDQCFQVVSDSVDIPVRHVDLSNLDPDAQDVELQDLVREDRKVPFDLEKPPLVRIVLIRLGTDRHVAIVGFHHVVADGWSLNIAMDEVAAFYAEQELGRTADMPDPPSFRRYADWLAGVDIGEARNFWKETLEGAAPCRLPFRQDSDGEDSPENLEYRDIFLSEEDTQTILQQSREAGVTSATVMQAAWALLLSRFEHQDRVLFAMSNANRPAVVDGIDRIFGPLMAVLPCNLEIENDTAVGNWLRLLQKRQVTAREFDYLSPAEHQRLAGFSPVDEFLNSMLILEDMPAARSGVWTELGITFRELSTYDRTTYPLNMFVYPGERMLFRLGFDNRQFSEESADEIIRFMHHLCLELVGDMNRPVADVTLPVGSTSSARLCGPTDLYDPSANLWEALHSSLMQMPLALESDRGGALASGADLLEQAARLDAALDAAGVADGQTVALYLDPGFDYVAAILASIRRGSPYALLDPLLPFKAVQNRLQDSGIKALISAQDMLQRLSLDDSITAIASDRLKANKPTPSPRPAAEPEAPVLMVWTSGSTGTPKAPILSQSALLNRLAWDRVSFPRETSPKGILKTSPAFVDGVAEVLQPLFDGFPCVVPDPDAARTPSALVELIHRSAPTRLVATPSFLRAMLDDDRSESPWPLKRLHISGESLPADLLARIRKKTTDDCILLNIYGSAEVTADVTVHQIATVENGTTVSIGTPLPGCEVWLLDRNLRPVPDGAVGEMYIGGRCLSLGYHAQETLSQTRFINWSVSEGVTCPLYATGDLARRDSSGRLVHMGRKDGQVKIRGVRIEPGEVEARLLDISEIRQAVVTTAQSGVSHCLVAYIEPEGIQSSAIDRETEWRGLYDQNYQDVLEGADALNDFRIWQSAITGELIPETDMRAWVDATLSLALEGDRHSLIEVGCGQGLLLGRMAAEFEHYLGTDISRTALDCVEQLKSRDPALEHVNLIELSADKALPSEVIPDGGFATALISSVVQYFPDKDYLIQALRVLQPALRKGARLILSDLRAQHLRDLLATEIVLSRAAKTLDRRAAQRRIHELIETEPELLVDPRFFLGLKSVLPRLAGIEARPKPGEEDNELNAYRYDLILYLDERPIQIDVKTWHSWSGIDAMIAELKSGRDLVAFRGIPHRRLHTATVARDLLIDDNVSDVSGWRARIERACADASFETRGTDAATLAQLAKANDFTVTVHLDLERDPTSYLAIFQRNAENAPLAWAVEPPIDSIPDESATNTPYSASASKNLIDRARSHLRASLPPSFVPEQFAIVSEWPKSASQKILKHRLPPIRVSEESQSFSAPSGATETSLADLWRKSLDRDRVSRDAEFFECGGNSLMLTQLAFSIGKNFGIKFPLRTAFSAPVLKDMAANIDAIVNGEAHDNSDRTGEQVRADIRLADAVGLPSPYQGPLWPADGGRIFHTGPGGMLSHWILRRLLLDPDLSIISIGFGDDPVAARRKLADEWSELGFGRLDLIDRLEILPGGLDRPKFGLTDHAWNDLASRVDAIVHSGIRINMAERYGAMRAANVLGTREVLRLATQTRAKPVHAIGSYAVIDHGTAAIRPMTVDEDTPLPSFEGLENDYRKSRWVSETMLSGAIGRGLPVTLHRIPPISGDSNGHVADPGEVLWRVIRAMVVTGSAPASDRTLDMMPVDHAVEAVLTLARDVNAAPGVNHVTGGAPITWNDIAETLRGVGYPIDSLTPADWYKRLSDWAKAHPDDSSMGGLLPLVNEEGRDHSHFHRIDGERTKSRLSQLGMDVKSTSTQQIRKSIEFLMRDGFLRKAS